MTVDEELAYDYECFDFVVGFIMFIACLIGSIIWFDDAVRWTPMEYDKFIVSDNCFISNISIVTEQRQRGKAPTITCSFYSYRGISEVCDALYNESIYFEFNDECKEDDIEQNFFKHGIETEECHTTAACDEWTLYDPSQELSDANILIIPAVFATFNAICILCVGYRNIYWESNDLYFLWIGFAYPLKIIYDIWKKKQRLFLLKSGKISGSITFMGVWKDEKGKGHRTMKQLQNEATSIQPLFEAFLKKLILSGNHIGYFGVQSSESSECTQIFYSLGEDTSYQRLGEIVDYQNKQQFSPTLIDRFDGSIEVCGGELQNAVYKIETKIEEEIGIISINSAVEVAIINNETNE